MKWQKKQKQTQTAFYLHLQMHNVIHTDLSVTFIKILHVKFMIFVCLLKLCALWKPHLADGKSNYWGFFLQWFQNLTGQIGLKLKINWLNNRKLDHKKINLQLFWLQTHSFCCVFFKVKMPKSDSRCSNVFRLFVG